METQKNNEPAVRIRGGSTRASRMVPRAELPMMSARERVQRALQSHDPDARDRAVTSFGAPERAMVRLIAGEGVISNVEPALRYNAISALAHLCDAENWNQLVDLAHFGEDFYVRGHALLALGSGGVSMALPVLANHLAATETFEKSCARRAVALLARKTSLESVRAHASFLDPATRTETEGILEEMGRPRPSREQRETPSWKERKTE